MCLQDERSKLVKVASRVVSAIGRSESAGEIEEGAVPESPGKDKIQAPPEDYRKGKSGKGGMRGKGEKGEEELAGVGAPWQGWMP